MQNKHILIVLKFGSFFGYIESLIKELTLNNKVTLCVQEDNKIDSANYYIDSSDGSLVVENLRLNKKIILAKKTDNLNIIYGVKRRDSWAKILRIIRETLNYISYLIRGDHNTFFQNQSNILSTLLSSSKTSLSLFTDAKRALLYKPISACPFKESPTNKYLVPAREFGPPER